jgi:hypothetical protein
MAIAWYFWLLAALAAWTVLSLVVGLLLGPLLGSTSRRRRRGRHGETPARRAVARPR